MRIIDNIDAHIERNDGIHGLFTGTFDPSHMGHVRALLEAKDAGKIDASIIVLPHSINPEKKPIDLETRRRWLALSIQEFASDLDGLVVIAGEEIHSGAQIDSLVHRHKKRLLRIAGADKGITEISHGEIQGFPLRERDPQISSTFIKQQIAQNNLDALKGKVARQVLDDILRLGHYGDTSL